MPPEEADGRRSEDVEITTKDFQGIRISSGSVAVARIWDEVVGAAQNEDAQLT